METASTVRERVQEIHESSLLEAPAAVLWRHATTPAGVNAELWPLLRMTFPGDADAGDFLANWQPGRRLFRSWILLAGIVPVEYDDLTLVEVDEGRRFLERSSLLSQRVWEHERTIEPHGTGCRVTDRVRFEPRVAALARVHAALFALVFRWRHRNLRRQFCG